MPEQPAPLLLREGALFRGLVVLPHGARIEGRVHGEILADGPVWIGPAAHVEATVEADEVIVAGRVDGRVEARFRIELRPGARVRAALRAPRVSLAEGSLLEGSCRSGEPGSPRGPASP